MLKYMYPNKIELSHTAEIDFFQIFLHLTVGKDTCDRKTVKKKFWLTYILKNFQDYENWPKIEFSQKVSKWYFFSSFVIFSWKASKIMDPGQTWRFWSQYWEKYWKKHFFEKRPQKRQNSRIRIGEKNFFSWNYLKSAWKNS